MSAPEKAPPQRASSVSRASRVPTVGRGVSPVGFGRAPEGQQPDVPRRVKPIAARRLRRSLTGQGLTRLVGLLWPGHAQPRHEENDMSTPDPATPTERQLRYLRALAARTATTFVSPRTRVDASREIARLRGLHRAPRLELPHDDDDAHGYATAVNREEITGFGSSARWRGGTVRPSRSAARGDDVARAGYQLARYSISTGERVLHAEAHGGSLRIVDRPAGRWTLVCRGGAARAGRLPRAARRLPEAGRGPGQRADGERRGRPASPGGRRCLAPPLHLRLGSSGPAIRSRGEGDLRSVRVRPSLLLRSPR